MAKRKKTAANPARGFATTSIASKPRPEVPESESKPSPRISKTADGAPPSSEDAPPSTNSASGDAAGQQNQHEKPLSPEEFEKQLEESELQLLVEKHSQKIKRDAQRQRTRLDTDRRLLRGQADLVNAPKWLPSDMVGYILDLIKAETRFSASNVSSEHVGTGKLPSEEDMIVRLWTLRQTLAAAGFPEVRVETALKHILDIAPNVSSAFKDSIWGLDEALDWLARECSLDELPSYEYKGKPISKGNKRRNKSQNHHILSICAKQFSRYSYRYSQHSPIKYPQTFIELRQKQSVRTREQACTVPEEIGCDIRSRHRAG